MHQCCSVLGLGGFKWGGAGEMLLASYLLVCGSQPPFHALHLFSQEHSQVGQEECGARHHVRLFGATFHVACVLDLEPLPFFLVPVHVSLLLRPVRRWLSVQHPLRLPCVQDLALPVSNPPVAVLQATGGRA